MTLLRWCRLAHVRLLAIGGALALGLASAGGLAAPELARSEPGGAPCPGSGSEPCPYSSVATVGQRAESVLRFPEAVALGPEGDVYVADQLSYVVQRFSPAGTFLGEWGSYGGGHGQFGPIGGLAVDGEGNVYVVDSSHNRIEKFDSAGDFLASWGHTGGELGQFRFFSSQSPSQPPGGGIAVAGEYVYVADSGNNRIERFNLNGGEPIQWGSGGSGAGQFSYPRALAADSSEVVVSDDDNHRVEKFTVDGEFESQAGSPGTGPGQFGFPYGIALDGAGNVYVADDINHRIVKLSPQLGFVREWGGFGSAPGKLAFPRALASDPTGDTYVADTANDRIQVFDPNDAYLRTIGVSARAPGELTAPQGLAVDPTGRLFVSDTVDDRVEAFSAGEGSFLFSWSDAGGNRSGFTEPSGIAIDPRGSMYVADTGDERVVHLWGDGTYLSEIAGPAELGGAQLRSARSLAVSPVTGDLYAADTNHNRVLVYSPKGALLEKIGAGEGDGSAGHEPGEFDHPNAVAVGPSGEVFVADTGNHRIVRLSPDGSFAGEFGQPGSGPVVVHDPTGVAVDAAGRIYVVDSTSNRVEVFGPSGEHLAQWGQRGDGPGYLSQPTVVTVGCEGSVYVADTDNNRVERFDPVSPAGTGCVAAGSWPPPLDVPPLLHVILSRRVGVLARRAVALSVSCQRGCKVLVTATLTTPSPRRTVPLLTAARPLPPKLAGHVRLRLTASSLRRLRKALGRRHGMTATVHILAVGPTGRRTVLTRAYSVSR